MRPLTWRAGQLYLLLFAVVALVTAGWTYRYWSRAGASYRENLPRFAERLPGLLHARVARSPVPGAVESAAVALWIYGPIAGPVAALGCGGLVLFLRRRRRWALALTLVLAAAALPVAWGGFRALRGLEDRHYYARSPYVRVYRALAIPLVSGSIALLALAGLELARRRSAV